MSNEKVSIQDLVDVISQRTGYSKKKADDFIRVFQDTVEEALIKDGLVKIKGFGTFKLVWNEPRKSVNVQTGQEYIIPGHNKVSFVPEAGIKDLINEPMLKPETASKPEINPLEKLNDQAEEIKMLLSELSDLKPEDSDDSSPIPLIQAPAYTLADVKEDKAEETKTETVVESQPESTSLLQEEQPEVQIVVEEKEIVEESKPLVEEPIAESVTESAVVVEEVLDAKQAEESKQVTEEPVIEQPVQPIHFTAEVVANEAILTSTQTADYHAPADYKIHERDIPIKKKKKTWIFIVLIVVLVGGLGTFLYFSYTQKIKFDLYKVVSSVEALFTQKEDNTKSQKITAKPKAKTVVLPSDTITNDTIKKEEPKLTDAKKDGELAKNVNPIEETKKVAEVKPAVKVSVSKGNDNSKAQTANKAKNEQIAATNQKEVKVASSAKLSGSIFEQPRQYKEFIATVTIKKGSHLTLIAEKYYGHRNFWVFIYEANKDRISNPDALPAGFKVNIPLLDPALVDASNPECVEYGRRLEVKYVNEFKAKK